MCAANSKLPGELMNNLEYDKTGDTRIAIDYLKKCQSTFYPIPRCENKEYDVGFDSYKNKIYHTYYINLLEITSKKIDNDKLNTQHAVLLAIAKEIENKSELFVQLEVLLRGKNANNIRNFDIPILVQHLKGLKTDEAIPSELYPDAMMMTQDTPLAALGLIVYYVMYDMPINIVSSTDTAVICYLFARICIESGIPDTILNLFYTLDIPYEIKELKKFDNGGCVLVVTSKCDIDSAVECALNATHDRNYPWWLKRIIVQECVYDDFKTALAFKTEASERHDLKTKCADIRTSKEKVYLFEYVDSEEVRDTNDTFVYIEAYRTTKELLKLTDRHQPWYMSLWCADLSTANEIAHNTTVNTIWINGYGVFDSCWTAGSYYKCLQETFDENQKSFKVDKLQPFAKATSEWQKKSLETRKEMVFAAVDERFRIALSGWEPMSSVHVDRETMCIAYQKPIGVVLLKDTLNEVAFTDILKFLLLGNGIVLSSKKHDEYKKLMDLGLPVFVEPTNPNVFVISVSRTCHLKVIWSSYGETFAN